MSLKHIPNEGIITSIYKETFPEQNLSEYPYLNNYQQLFTKEKSITCLPPPTFRVGYNGYWKDIPPSSLKKWDILGLEPYSPAKNIEYFILTPYYINDLFRKRLYSFFRELCCVYQNNNLGNHLPANKLSDGGVPGLFITKDRHNKNYYENSCLGLGKYITENLKEYSASSSVVVYMVDDFYYREYREYHKIFLSSVNYRDIIVQHIPQHMVLNSVINPVQLKQLSMTIFSKTRRIYIPSGTENFLPLYEPLFALSPTISSRSVLPEDKVIHISYKISKEYGEDQVIVTMVWSDSRGELLEYRVESSYDYPDFIIHKLYNLTYKHILPQVDHNWHLVIAKVDGYSNEEINNWQERTRALIAQKDDKAKNIASIILVSVKTENNFCIYKEEKDDKNSSFIVIPDERCIFKNTHGEPPIKVGYLINDKQESLQIELNLIEGFHEQGLNPDEVIREILSQYHNLTWLTFGMKQLSIKLGTEDRDMPLHLSLTNKLENLRLMFEKEPENINKE
eukprot:TRINITY_DN13493_c0_g1_i1.p1 TRINITY_DN13493_c0_g1~~TRINITY_DN13493_c0_g1_i1.p1  ORF type:complete len:509 (-),score=87.25 TRINITY_DN13493_c0_g1_i1:64-1590(-)